MMPTRLQNGISMELLQWSLSANEDDSRNVLIRLTDEELYDVLIQNLQNAGLTNIKPYSPMCISGTVTAAHLQNISLCPGICSIAAMHHRNDQPV